MNDYETKQYEPFKIPRRDAAETVKDEKYIMYCEMRRQAIETEEHFFDYSKMYFQQTARIRQSKVFYRQAVFMKDFEDDYTGRAEFSSYFPHYDMMSYEQFRTYFTWRTNVRKGLVNDISVSYAFVYIYELLNNIGIDAPKDGLKELESFGRAYKEYGLGKLKAFWKSFKKHNLIIDKYLIKWERDYRMYYGIPVPDEIAGDFDFYCRVSKYDIKNSDFYGHAFYGNETGGLIEGCFSFVIDKLKAACKAARTDLDDFIYPVSERNIWTPFNGALFDCRTDRPDAVIKISVNEIYVCRRNKWYCGPVPDSGRQLIGYIMKQMESALRQAAGYKRKLPVTQTKVTQGIVRRFNGCGILLDNIIIEGAHVYFAESNRKSVTVDSRVLEKVREEALVIQEKLSAEPEDEIFEDNTAEQAPVSPGSAGKWAAFKLSLTKTELEAVRFIQRREDIRSFAGENGVMLEVLIDGINQKAYDTINDTVMELDDDVTVYDDYYEEIKRMVQ